MLVAFQYKLMFKFLDSRFFPKRFLYNRLCLFLLNEFGEPSLHTNFLINNKKMSVDVDRVLEH